MLPDTSTQNWMFVKARRDLGSPHACGPANNKTATANNKAGTQSATRKATFQPRPLPVLLSCGSATPS